MKWTCALLVLIACRDAGTIEILPGDELATCTAATYIRAYFIPGGACGVCGCGVGSCPACEAGCLEICANGTCRLPIADVEERGIVFDPPAAGPYAAVYQYLDDGGTITAVVCHQFSVESDGTQSSDQDAERTACCVPSSPSSAHEPLLQ